MPINLIERDALTPVVQSQGTMLALIRKYRMVPFFANPIEGYSIEEHTLPELWFTEESLGPWDWKIECIQDCDIAYGKFLWGGKASFAMVDVYKELMNWRRSLPKYKPSADQQRILDYMQEHDAISVADVRKLLGIKKSAADAILGRLQMQTRLVTGVISRVYSGAEQKYSGWQRSSFCTPEALFEELDLPFPGYVPHSLKSDLTPAESLDYVKETVRAACGEVPDKVLLRMLG